MTSDRDRGEVVVPGVDPQLESTGVTWSIEPFHDLIVAAWTLKLEWCQLHERTVALPPELVDGVARARREWRMHRRRDGSSKLKFTEEQARRVSARMSEEQADFVDAYACNHCEWWHVGRRPRVLLSRDKLELGVRVTGNLKAENHGSVEDRMEGILSRCRRINRCAA